MRLGLVAVVLFGACGPLPEEPPAPGATLPVRVARLSVVGNHELISTDDPLALDLRLWSDGVLLGELHYRGQPDPFDQLGEIPLGGRQWRVEANINDASGQRSFELDTGLAPGAPLSSLALCLYEKDGAALESDWVFVAKPSPGVAVAPPEDATMPLLKAIGFGHTHTELQRLDEPGEGPLHDPDVSDRSQLVPGVYRLERFIPQPRQLAVGVIQLDQTISAEEFALQQ